MSTYIGRDFGGGSQTLTVPPPPLPPPLDVPLVVRQTISNVKEDDRTSNTSNTSSHNSHRSHHSRRSKSSAKSSDHSDHSGRHRHHGRKYHADAYPEPDKIVEADNESYFEPVYIWSAGVLIAVVAALYFYWLSCECDVYVNEEANLTMQYAIDNAMSKQKAMDSELSEIIEPVAVSPISTAV